MEVVWRNGWTGLALDDEHVLGIAKVGFLAVTAILIDGTREKSIFAMAAVDI